MPPPKFATAAALGESALNLEILREDGRAELVEILEMHPGNKLLVLDSALGNLLSHILTDASSLFEENGVTQIIELGMDLSLLARGGASLDFLHVLFFVRPSVEHCQLVAEQIASVRGLKAQGQLCVERFNVYFAPNKSLVCEQVLEDEGVLEVCDLGEFQLNLIPLEKDVVSLELEESFRECKLEGDMTSLTAVTQSLMKLQGFFGVVPNVKCVGPMARDVAKMMCRARVENSNNSNDSAGSSSSSSSSKAARVGGGGNSDGLGLSEVDTLVLMDREVDLVTPMVTPLTYEGLIEELIPGGIKNNVIKVSRAVAGADDEEKKGGQPAEDQPPPPPFVPITLNGNDKLYTEIRDLNIEKLGPFLGAKAKAIRGQYDAFRTNKDASITDIHAFVKQIPGLKENYNSLNTHINVTEEIKRTTDGSSFRERWKTEREMLEGEPGGVEVIEDMVAMQAPVLQVLRLLCLQSLTSGGIISAKFDTLRREIIQTYGYEFLFTLVNLEKLGMVRRREVKWLDSGSPFAAQRRVLRLIDEEVNVMRPMDISYVSSGYAPLSVRLVQQAVNKGSAGLAGVVLPAQLPHPKSVLDFTQFEEPAALDLAQIEASFLRAANAASSSSASASSSAVAVAAAAAAAAVGAPSSSSSSSVAGTAPKMTASGALSKDTTALDNASFSSSSASQVQKQTPLTSATGEGGKKVMLVYYLGGVTYMEIAALRFLSEKPEFPFRIVVCATKLINGNSLVKSFVHEWEGGHR